MKLVQGDPPARPYLSGDLRRGREQAGADVFDDRATREVQLGPGGLHHRGDDVFGAPEPTVRVVVGDDADGGGRRRARPPSGRSFRAALVGSVCTLLLCAGGGWALWRWQARGEEKYRATPLEAVSQETGHRLQEPPPPRAERSLSEAEPARGMDRERGGALPIEPVAVVDTSPRIVSAEVELSFESLLRDLYRDLRLDAEEETRLRAFRERHRLAQAGVAAFEERLLERLAVAAEHLRLGRWWVERGDFAEAEREYRRAAEVDPADPLAWAQLGAVLVGRDRGEEAFACYQRALGLDPRCWLAHYNLAVWHARRGEVEQSLARAEAALTSVPSRAVAERQAVVQGLLEEPALASVRDDPRFARLLASAPVAEGEGRR